MLFFHNFNFEFCYQDYKNSQFYFRIKTKDYETPPEICLDLEDLHKIYLFFNSTKDFALRTFSWANLSFSFFKDELKIIYKDMEFNFVINSGNRKIISEMLLNFINKF